MEDARGLRNGVKIIIVDEVIVQEVQSGKSMLDSYDLRGNVFGDSGLHEKV